MTFEEYNTLVSEQLEKNGGMKHGFILTVEGTFYRHLIFIDRGVKKYLLGLIKKSQRLYIAEIIVEPSSITPFMVGANKGGRVEVIVFDERYTEAIDSAVSFVNSRLASGGSATYLKRNNMIVLKYV